MSEDLVQTAKTAAELESAVEALGEATGALEPVREITGWLADIVRYRRVAYQAKLMMKAAEKIEATGLPVSAVPDKLLRTILEEGPMEDDEDMQERWANLLANAAIDEPGRVRAAFPQILHELEPEEAALLDEFASRSSPSNYREKRHSTEQPGTGGARQPALDNLARLGLLFLKRKINAMMGGSDQTTDITGAYLTDLGWAFVQACHEPAAD